MFQNPDGEKEGTQNNFDVSFMSVVSYFQGKTN
jgi:hypothetical protein